MRKVLLLCLLVCLVICQAATSPQAREIRGLRFGMSMKEVKRLIEKQDKKVVPVEINCSIPLGLDFYDGLPVFTRDTDIMLLATYGYDALYFHDDKLIGLRKDLQYLDEFVSLKKKYPTGNFSTHRFPKEQSLRTVFRMEDGGQYGFTNRYFDFYLFDDQARRDAISRVQGSFCWHIKLTSPNLPRYPAEYAQCVRRERRMDKSKLGEDLEQCKRFCAQTPEVFASSECTNYCQEAYSLAQ